MNYTTNYNLPQWEDTDAVRREDVNSAMAAIDSAIAAAGGNCRIEVVSYNGIGHYGTYNTRIAFSQKPEAVLILSSSYKFLGHVAGNSTYVRTYLSNGGTVTAYDCPCSWSDNTLLFHSDDSPEAQANEYISGHPITYYAIGFTRNS